MNKDPTLFSWHLCDLNLFIRTVVIEAAVLPSSSFITVIISVFIDGATGNVTRALRDHHALLKTLARSNSVTIVPHDSVVAPPGGCVIVNVEGICRVHMHLKVWCFTVVEFSAIEEFGNSFALVW